MADENEFLVQVARQANQAVRDQYLLWKGAGMPGGSQMGTIGPGGFKESAFNPLPMFSNEAANDHVNAYAQAQIMALRDVEAQNRQHQQLMSNMSVQQSVMQARAYNSMDPYAADPAFSQGTLSPRDVMRQQHYMMSVNQMNPYVAGGMSQGNMSQNLVDPQYMTTPRFGIFRDELAGQGPGIYGQQPGFLSDFALQQGWRGTAMHEDPYEARIMAARRQRHRRESLTGGLLSAGTMMAGMGLAAIPGVGWAGALAGFAAEPAVSWAYDQYTGRRAQTQRVQDITKGIVTGGEDLGPGGRGLSYRSSAEVMREMRKYAAQSATFNEEDMEDILRTSAEAGTMRFVGRKDEIIRAMKQQSEMLNTFMKITGDPDLRSAFDRMARFQTMGVSIGNQSTLLNNIQAYARMAGVGVQGMMETGVQMGAQQATNIGAAPVMGMELGAMTQGITGIMAQRGMLNPLQFAIRGGTQGVAQNLSGMMISNVHQSLARVMPALLDERGQIDPARMEQFVSGELDLPDLIAKSTSRLRDPGFRREYMLNQKDLVATAESKMSEVQRLKLIRRNVQDVVNLSSGRLNTDQGFQALFGDQWREMKLATSKETLGALVGQQEEQMNRSQFAAEKKIEERNKWYNRWATGAATAFDDTMDKWTYERTMRAAEEQELEEAQAVGRAYVHGKGQRLATKKLREASREYFKRHRKRFGDVTADERLEANKALQDYADDVDSDLEGTRKLAEVMQSVEFQRDVFSDARTGDYSKRLRTVADEMQINADSLNTVVSSTTQSILNKAVGWGIGTPDDMSGKEMRDRAVEAIKRSKLGDKFDKLSVDKKNQLIKDIVSKSLDRMHSLEKGAKLEGFDSEDVQHFIENMQVSVNRRSREIFSGEAASEASAKIRKARDRVRDVIQKQQDITFREREKKKDAGMRFSRRLHRPEFGEFEMERFTGQMATLQHYFKDKPELLEQLFKRDSRGGWVSYAQSDEVKQIVRGMTEEDKAAFKSSLYGARKGAAYLDIMGSGAEGLKDVIRASTEAQAVADKEATSMREKLTTSAQFALRGETAKTLEEQYKNLQAAREYYRTLEPDQARGIAGSLQLAETRTDQLFKMKQMKIMDLLEKHLPKLD